MQPTASHCTPSCRLASLRSRASPSAASHSLIAKVSRLLCSTASRPSPPRMAAAWPSPATSTSGRGVVTAHRLAATASTAPLQRSGVRSRHSSRIPAVPAAAARCRTPAHGRPRPAGWPPTAPPRSSSRCRRPSASRTPRRSRTAWPARRECPSASPRPRPPAWPADWRARRRARRDGNERRHRAWSRARRPARPE